MQTAWSMMRLSSLRMTRRYCARSGIVTPISFSTAMAKPELFMKLEQ